MSKRTLIHIGMPKSGSTWLQRQLFKPANGYANRYGPLESNLAFINPRPFQWSLPQQLEKLKSAGDRVPVISGETLAGNPLTGGADAEMILHRLKQALPDANILIVIREQNSMLRSLYQLLVNWGSPYNLKTLLEPALPGNTPRFDPQYLCYDHLIQAYQSAFGKERVLTLPYEDFALDADGFVQAINRFAGVDCEQFPTEVDAGKIVNRGRSLASLEIKRWYNRFVARTAFDLRGVYTPRKIHGSGNYSPWVPQRVNEWQERRFRQMVQYSLGDYYAASNQRTQSLTGLDLSAAGYHLSEQ